MPQIRRNSVTFNPITKTFTQSAPPEKQPRVELTVAEKERLIGDFRDVFKRSPDEDEIETLFIEERKIRSRRR